MEIQENASPQTMTALSAFRHRNFRIFFVGQTISFVGTWSQVLAISWLVWRITDSPLWLGLIGFSIQFPILVLGLFGGAAADRYDRLRFLKIFQILCMTQAFILAFLTMAGYIEVWHILVLSILLGTVYAFEFPMRQAFITDTVGKRDLLNAISLHAATVHATRIAGPSVAGLIVAWQGEGACFLFNGLTFLCFMIFLLSIDRNALIDVRNDRTPFIRSIVEGLAHMWGEPSLKLSVSVICVISLLGMPVIYLMPIFADRVFGGGAMQLGWLMASAGTGSLTGAILLAHRKSSGKLLQLAAGSSVLAAISLIGFSLAKNLWLALPAIAITGFFQTITISSSITLLQGLAPDQLRGRMMSLFTTAFMGLAPVGSLFGGFVAKEIGAPKTVIICGIMGLLVSIAILIYAKREQDPALLKN